MNQKAKIQKAKEPDEALEKELVDIVRLYASAGSVVDIKKANIERKKLRDKLEKQNEKLFFKLLDWERKVSKPGRMLINKTDNYLLNEHEKEVKCQGTCQMINDIKAAGFFAEVGNEYPFYSYIDEAKEGKTYYVLFVDETKSPEDQMSSALKSKIDRGYHPAENEWPKEKVIWHKRALVEHEFHRFFQITEDNRHSI